MSRMTSTEHTPSTKAEADGAPSVHPVLGIAFERCNPGIEVAQSHVNHHVGEPLEALVKVAGVCS